MSIYDEMQGIAQEILTEFKQGVISYIKITPGNGPRDNPGASSVTSYVMKGGAAGGVAFKYVQSGLAIASDLQIIAPVDARYTPDKKDMIDVDGTRYKIMELQVKPAAGTPVAHLFIIRKAA